MKIIATLLLLLFAYNVQSQEISAECLRILKEADSLAVKVRDYELAINKYNAAKICDEQLTPQVNEGIVEVYVLIEGEKRRAISEKNRADQLAIVAQKERDEARLQTRKAKAQYLNSLASQALQNNQQTEAIRFMHYAQAYDPNNSDWLKNLMRIIYDNGQNSLSNRNRQPLPIKVIPLDGELSGFLPSPDGTRLLTWSEDDNSHQLSLWYANGRMIMNTPYSGRRKFFKSVLDHTTYDLFSTNFPVWAPDGKTYYNKSSDNIEQWSSEGGQIQEPATADDWDGDIDGTVKKTYTHEKVRSILQMKDGKGLITFSSNLLPRNLDNLQDTSFLGSIKIWDNQQNELAAFNVEEEVIHATIHPNNTLFATISRVESDISMFSKKPKTHIVRIWDMEGNELVKLRFEDNVNKLRFMWMPDGSGFLTIINYFFLNRGFRQPGKDYAQLWDLQGKQRVTFKDDSGLDIWGALFFGDQGLLTWGKRLRLWDLNGELLHNSESSIDDIFWTPDPDNKTLVYVNGDAIQFNNPKGQTLGAKHAGIINGWRWSPDNQSMLSWSDDNTAKLWDLSGNVKATLQHEESVTGARWTPNGQQILTWSEDNTAKLWNLNGDLSAIYSHESDVLGGIFSKNGTSLLTLSDDQILKNWSLNSTDRNHTLQHEELKGVKVSPDGKSLVSWNYTEAKWWTMSGTLIGTFKHRFGKSIAFLDSSDGIITGNSSEITIWDNDGQQKTSIRTPEQKIIDYFPIPQAKILITEMADSLQIWDLNGKLQWVVKSPPGIEGYQLSPDNKRILLTTDRGKAFILNLIEQTITSLDHEYFKNETIKGKWDTDGQQILTWAGDFKSRNEVYLWDKNGNKTASFLLDDGTSGFANAEVILDAFFHPSDDIIITRSSEKVTYWNSNGTILQKWDDKNTDIYEAIQSANTLHFLGSDRSEEVVRVYNLEGHKLIEILHKEDEILASWSPERQLLLTWPGIWYNTDQFAAIWDLDGNQLATFKHNGPILGTSWILDGKGVLTWSEDGTAKVWIIDVEWLLASTTNLGVEDFSLIEKGAYDIEETISLNKTYTPLPWQAEEEEEWLKVLNPSTKVLQSTSLRTLPNASSIVKKRLGKGTEVTILEKTGRYWWKVQVGGKTGYVKAHLLQRIN